MCSYTNQSARKMTKAHPTFLSLGWLWCDISIQLFVFHFFHVLRAKRSGFNLHGAHQFMNPLSFSGIFLIFEINVPEKDLFRLVLKLLLNSKVLLKFGPGTIQTQENLKNLREKKISPLTKERIRETISTNTKKIMKNKNLYYLFMWFHNVEFENFLFLLWYHWYCMFLSCHVRISEWIYTL